MQVKSAAIICINKTENLPFTHLKVRCGHIDKIHSETCNAVILWEHSNLSYSFSFNNKHINENSYLEGRELKKQKPI